MQTQTSNDFFRLLNSRYSPKYPAASFEPAWSTQQSGEPNSDTYPTVCTYSLLSAKPLTFGSVNHTINTPQTYASEPWAGEEWMVRLAFSGLTSALDQAETLANTMFVSLGSIEDILYFNDNGFDIGIIEKVSIERYQDDRAQFKRVQLLEFPVYLTQIAQQTKLDTMTADMVKLYHFIP